jgi:hypothetical protein
MTTFRCFMLLHEHVSTRTSEANPKPVFLTPKIARSMPIGDAHMTVTRVAPVEFPDSYCSSYFGTLIRPSHRLLLFSSREYSMICVSVRSVKVRLLPQSSVNALGS